MKDARLPWGDPFPYDHLRRRLEESGAESIGPDSTAMEVKDALFQLMAAGGPTQADRIAWDALRQADERLVLDFFLYPVPGDVDAAMLDALWSVDPPVELPDFRVLADIPPDLSALAIPATFPDADDDGRPGATDFTADGSLRIEATPVDVLALLEDDDE